MKNNKKGIIIGLIVVVVVAGFFLIKYFNQTGKSLVFSGHEYGISESLSFENGFNFNKEKGKYIEYEVENIGSGNIKIQINNGEEKNIKPNGIESLVYELKKNNEDVEFKAYSKNDRVKIKYDIKQDK